ncbi:DUF4230 domain-containing protein [Lutispora sp.]|uniref:DUF4230 domain-containing protein n=1 Tax=Lutispora sp. TaxID=2828727 RepID=UPI00356A41BC
MNLKNIISMKTIIILALILAILFLAYKLVDSQKTPEPIIEVENQTIEDSTVIMERVERLWEMSSNKYFYSNVLAFKDNLKIKDFQVPFTEKSYLIKYDGYLKAGINAEDMEILFNEGKTIKIKLKNSKILDHVIDEKSVYVYDEKNSIFNNLSIKDIFNQLSEEKVNIESKLVEKGFLIDTNNNIKIFLEEFLRNLGYETIEIEFED